MALGGRLGLADAYAHHDREQEGDRGHLEAEIHERVQGNDDGRGDCGKGEMTASAPDEGAADAHEGQPAKRAHTKNRHGNPKAKGKLKIVAVRLVDDVRL